METIEPTTIEPELTSQEQLPVSDGSAQKVDDPSPAPPEVAKDSGIPLIGKIKSTYFFAGGAVILIGIIAIIFGGSLFSNRSSDDNGQSLAAIASPTQSANQVALLDIEDPTSTPTNTSTPAPPTVTFTPTTTPTITLTPTPTVPPGIPFSRINNITIDDQNRYVVEYETFEFIEEISSTTLHVHFFFDTVRPENAGVPGSGPWILYGGPRPFTGYTVSARPAAATQMCILVANPDHSIQLDSGNCFDLPSNTTP